ncbi:MAG TPA: hypothetical protein VFE15_14450 [Marmoricola sp.]|jgi:hypothetical protein|nr:hypothetical protein [Marmoricola sp.]
MRKLFKHASDGIPDLVPIPPIAELPVAKMQASGRYLGTYTAPEDGSAPIRVIGHSLAAKSAVRLSLSPEALDVVRIAGSFRILAASLRGARGAESFAGKPVADLLVIRWEHGGRLWDSGFRLDPARSVRDAAKAQLGRTRSTIQPEVGSWVRTISKMARDSKKGSA